MIEPLLLAVLLADARVTNIIGAGAAARVYPDILPQGAPSASTVPALVYQPISEVTGYTFDGPGLVRVRIQIDAYALSRPSTYALIRAVRDALHDYAGDPDGIQDLEAAGRRNMYESDTKLYRTSADWFATVRDQAA